MPKNIFQSKDVKKWPKDANFQVPASTGHKVEMAGANAAHNYGFRVIIFATKLVYRFPK